MGGEGKVDLLEGFSALCMSTDAGPECNVLQYVWPKGLLGRLCLLAEPRISLGTHTYGFAYSLVGMPPVRQR
jgi:hypothetical protein